jgi:hypothetical protein
MTASGQPQPFREHFVFNRAVLELEWEKGP